MVKMVVCSPQCSLEQEWLDNLGLACSNSASAVAAAWGLHRVWLNAQGSYIYHIHIHTQGNLLHFYGYLYNWNFIMSGLKEMCVFFLTSKVLG